jgi:hypothetical protein
MRPSRRPGETREAVAKHTLALAPSECWLVAEALASSAAARKTKPIAGDMLEFRAE